MVRLYAKMTETETENRGSLQADLDEIAYIKISGYQYDILIIAELNPVEIIQGMLRRCLFSYVPKDPVQHEKMKTSYHNRKLWMKKSTGCEPNN